jgi:hypothetical protein
MLLVQGVFHAVKVLFSLNFKCLELLSYSLKFFSKVVGRFVATLHSLFKTLLKAGDLVHKLLDFAI